MKMKIYMTTKQLTSDMMRFFKSHGGLDLTKFYETHGDSDVETIVTEFTKLMVKAANKQEACDDDSETECENEGFSLLTSIVETQYANKKAKNIWDGSPWAHIAKLENDYVGRVGENLIQKLCSRCGIAASIDGTKTKRGCIGDGKIKGRSGEAKTARAGTGKLMTFQHELGENPWNAEFMIFIDIAPSKFYITIFPNFTEEQYKSCCSCSPYFPSRKFCWRKKCGCFKFDTTESLNEAQSKVADPHTFVWHPDSDISHFKSFVDRIIPDE